MFLKWFPWRMLLRRFSRAHGFLDPAAVFAAFERFAQPAEVTTPLELLRAGVVFHARGLLNTRAIQSNLDWIWPFWVQRQFDPRDDAFLPRAFSLTHVNLTHRNWTAVGLPDSHAFPLVDPRGLVTPFFDGWSLDGWILSEDGDSLFPSRALSAEQRLKIEPNALSVCTKTLCKTGTLTVEAAVVLEDERPVCRVRYCLEADRDCRLAVALRPCNPEGVSFIHEIALSPDRRTWTVNDAPCAALSRAAERHVVSTYDGGDVAGHILERPESDRCACKVGMASAAAVFEARAGESASVSLDVALDGDREAQPAPAHVRTTPWREATANAAELRTPDARFKGLYDAALRSLILFSPGEVYPGPFTYKRFWFRDAAFILHAMLCAGFNDRVERALDRFPDRQKMNGFFYSQDGEWDANGAALWIFHRFCRLTGKPPKQEWRKPVLRAAKWIARKRCPSNAPERHAGLLPAGFSAEHLGNNDYYYWDDFWSVAGLRAAAAMCEHWRGRKAAQTFQAEADDLMNAISRSLQRSQSIRSHAGIPASPYRRMDSGAVGSIVAGYPLQLLDARDPTLSATASFLLDNCLVKGAFFHDLVHAGVNPYLTLHLAQVLLRAEDGRFLPLVERVAELASPTGQWPEAIHPRTEGGCMGDGQHTWASAEWVMIMRNMFVREESDRLILAGGIPESWLSGEQPLAFGPSPTRHGPVSVGIRTSRERVTVSWDAAWTRRPPKVEVDLAGCPRQVVEDGAVSSVTFDRNAVAEDSP